MRYTKYHKALAVLTAMGLIAATPMAALSAPVEQITVQGEDGNGTYDAVSNTDGKTGIVMSDGSTTLNGDVTVNGDVMVTNEQATSGSGSITSGVDISSANGGSAKLDIHGSINVDATQSDIQPHAYGITTNNTSTITIDNNVTAKAERNTSGILSYSNRTTSGGNNGTIIIGGDVTATSNKDTAYGVVSAVSSGTTIIINGDVKATSEESKAIGVDIYGNTEVTVGGKVEALGGLKKIEHFYYDNTSIGVNVDDIGSKVKIDEGIVVNGYNAYGIYADTFGSDGCIKINVGDDIKATGINDGTGIAIWNNADTVDIKVDGDIKGSNTGIYISEASENATTKITTAGTLSAENGHAIYVKNTGSKTTEPEITVWKIESTDTMVRVYNRIDGDLEENIEAEESIKSSINYIIRADTTENGETSSNGKIVLTGTSGKVTIGEGDKAKTYDTAHQGETITINVETVKGYKSTVQNNGAGTLTVNADGTYTLTIPEGGGVDLRAVLEKIEEQRKDNSTRNSERYSSSSSGGASSSSSGGTAIIYAPSTGTQAGDSSWIYDNAGWKLKKPDGNFANGEWRQVSWNGTTNWYHFNSNGYADGGWYTDTDGHKYYFYNAHDGAFGRMLTGWNEIDGKWYYFSTANTATTPLGSLLTSGTTPDGYQVNADGTWVQ